MALIISPCHESSLKAIISLMIGESVKVGVKMNLTEILRGLKKR